MIVRVEANVPWQVAHLKDGWLAVCEPLKLTVHGGTYAELMESIGETLDAVLSELMKSKELPEFLKTHGWALVSPLPAEPEGVRFDVPFLPAMMGANGPPRIVRQ